MANRSAYMGLRFSSGLQGSFYLEACCGVAPVAHRALSATNSSSSEASLSSSGRNLALAAVAHGDGGVAAQARALGAADGRSAEGFPKFFRGHFSEPGESRIDQARAGSEFGRSRGGSLAVPRANILADVAAEDVTAHARAEVLGNRPALLDREIRNALVGIELVGREDRIRRTSLDATRAGAAAIRSGQVGGKFERSEDHAEEEPRTFFLIDDAGVLADPAHAGVLGKDAFDDGAGIDVTARDEIGACESFA